MRGTARTGFLSTVKNFIAMNKVDLCIILEPRVSGDKAIQITEKISFSNVYIEEARGFAGGIWMC